MSRRPAGADELSGWLAEQGYLAGRGLATAVYLAMSLGQPLLLEGEAGVGKTELAKALSVALDARLVRLQCYEGLDANQALYEWDYARQLIQLRSLQDAQETDSVFTERFLVERPLLTAVRAGGEAVLLLDEVDRADEEFEAFLLEVLSDFQVTIPEIGTIRASRPPLVILTSNRTRELHDALKRRCLYCWIDYPDLAREVEIVRARAPEVDALLAQKVTAAVRRLRELDLVKQPGVAETIAWARAVSVLDGDYENGAVEALGAVVKDHDDDRLVTDRLEWVLHGDAAAGG